METWSDYIFFHHHTANMQHSLNLNPHLAGSKVLILSRRFYALGDWKEWAWSRWQGHRRCRVIYSFNYVAAGGKTSEWGSLSIFGVSCWGILLKGLLFRQPDFTKLASFLTCAGVFLLTALALWILLPSWLFAIAFKGSFHSSVSLWFTCLPL